MKKKLVILCMLIPLTLTMLFSCKLFNKNNDSGEDEGIENLIYGKGTALDVVWPDGASSELAMTFITELYEVTGVVPNLVTSIPEAPKENAIYIGRLENELSKRAYEKLDEIIYEAELDDKDSMTHVGYVFYSDGASVAIAYSEDIYDCTMVEAVDSFAESYVRGKGGLAAGAGVIETEEYRIMEFLEAADEKYYDAAWAKLLKETNDAELVNALKHFKTLYKDGAVSWLANLYDEEIGGFYYSNSGRDNVGFLPDVDTTYQAIVLISHMGMMSDFGYGAAKMPEWFKENVIKFVKSLQDPNGFFYHPQWTKELVDSKISRRSRDLTRAVALLQGYGASPTYDTPTGVKGDGILWDGTPVSGVSPSSLTTPLGNSTVTAVSKVIAVDSTASIASHLVSEEALLAYLSVMGDRIDNGEAYSVNNELASQTTQFIARDKTLKAQNANWSVADTVINFLNSKQNPENGSWSKNYNYNAVDGLFKAAHVYTDLGYEFPNARAAAMMAIDTITSEQATSHICNIYNCWCTIDMLVKNLKKFGSAAEANEVIQAIRDVAPESIEATVTKYLEFQKQDGTFSYYKDRCSAESQGMQVALQCNEGDMNATSLTYSVWNTVFSVLGIEEHKIPLHSSADYYNYLEIIDGIGGVIKDPVEPAKPITFDGDDVGAKSDEISTSFKSPNGDAIVVKDTREGRRGNVLEFRSYPGGGDMVYASANALTLGTCFVFEGDFCVTDSKSGYIAQINVGPSCYMLNLKLVNATDENGNAYKKVQILEASSQGSPRIERDLGVSAPLGEWFNVRIEYYIGSHDSVRINVFFNGKLIAVSDNYYDHSGKKITAGTGSPNKYYSYTQINIMSDQQAVILMDNLYVDKTDASFVPAHDLDNQPLINCDPPDRDEVVYDFEDLAVGKNYPTDFTVKENGGSIEVVAKDGGKQLNVTSNGDSAGIYLPAVIRTRKTNCAVAEMKIAVNSGTAGAALNVRLRADDKISGDVGSITAVNLEITEENGKKYVTLTEAPNGTTVSTISGATAEIGESFTLRLEYYEDTNILLIYVNGNLVASCDKLATGGGARSYGRLELSTVSGSISVSLDDVKAERIVKSFAEATKPAKDSVIHDFQEGLLEGVTAPDGAIISEGSDKLLKLKADGDTLSLPVNVRAVITNFTGLTAYVMTEGKAGGAYRIAFLAENGEAVIAFELTESDGALLLYEYTEHGRAEKPIASLAASSETRLDIEYYPALKVCQISANEACIAVTSVTYSGTELPIERINVTSLSGGVMLLDDCTAESYNKLFTEKIPAGENSEDGEEVMTFESSSTGNLPKALTCELLSLGADVRIEQMIGKLSAATKAIAFDSTSDTGGDYVAVGVTKEEEGYNAIVFETDLAFDRDDGGAISYQLFFEDMKGTGASRLYLTSIEYSSSTGKLLFKDYSGGSSSTTVQVDGNDAKLYRNDGAQFTHTPAGGYSEWFTLRIEIYAGARNEMRIKTYVNDTLLYVTNNFYNSHSAEEHSSLDLVEKVRVMALTNCEATLYMDNASLSKVCKVNEADPAGVTSKFFPTVNTPVIIVPSTPIDPNEKIPEVMDFEDGKLYSNISVEDKNGSNWPTLEAEGGKLSFVSDGGDYIYVKPTVSRGSYSYAKFEADMSFLFNVSETATNRAFYTFTVGGESGSSYPTAYRFNIEYNATNGVIKLVPYNGEKTYGTVFSKTVGTAGDPSEATAAFRLTIEYYIVNEDVVIVISIDGDPFSIVYSGEMQSYKNKSGVEVSHNMFYTYKSDGTGKPYLSMARIDMNSHSGTSTTVYLDNVTFVQKNAELDKSLIEPKPGTLVKGEYGEGDYHNTIGGYEYNISKIWSEVDLNNPNATGTPFLWRSGGGTNDARYITADGKSAAAGTLYSYIGIASFGTNKVLEYGQPHSDVRASRLYVKSANTTGNLYVFETDLVIGTVEGLNKGDELLAFHLRYGKTETSDFFGNLRIFTNGDGTYSIGYNAHKTYATVNASEWTNIRLEYYPEEGIARYYVGGEHVGSERIVTALDTSVYAFASISMAGAAYDAFVWLDNTVVTATDAEFEPIAGEVDELATVLPVKGGAAGITVLIHDDGDLDSMTILDRIYSKYSLNADVAMVVNRVYDTAAGAPKESAVSGWAPYINSPAWGLINHSLTHTFWGAANSESLTVDEETMYEEIVKSGEYLREAFGTERVLTFAYPGFSNVTDTLGYGKPKTYAAAKVLVNQHYVAGREYNFPTSNHKGLNLYDLNYTFLGASSISLGETNLAKNLESIDGAAGGKLTVLFSHKVVEDGLESTSNTSTVPASYIEAIAEKVSGYVSEGILWNAHYEDAMLYLKEAEAATVKSAKIGDTITVTLTDTLDNEIYNYALTVEVTVPDTWVGAKIVQGGNTTYARAFERDGKWMIYADIVPDAGDAVITPETEDLPMAPVIPCEHVDAGGDGICDKCTREYYDPATCPHTDTDGNGVCDKCESEYYDPATCPHADSDGNGVCDNCESEYYDPATCPHTDRDGDGYCDNCQTPHYDYDTCPHVDSDGDAVCDRCEGFYSDPATCRHKDADGDSLCDKCEEEYHDPSTCTHADENEDEICDKCGKDLSAPSSSEGDLGGSGADESGWLG